MAEPNNNNNNNSNSNNNNNNNNEYAVPQSPLTPEKLGEHAKLGDKKTCGDYILMDVIGKGGFGTVYKGLHRTKGFFVAAKEFKINKKNSKAMQSSLMMEINLLRALNHHNIVRYIAHIALTGFSYVVMEFIENGSLDRLVRRHGILPESLLNLYIAQVLEGLNYLHSQGVIHRDIKGANILITTTGSIKLADFGVATKVNNLSGDKHDEAFAGTPYWMAPEVIQMQSVSTACDIWSLGCTIIELLTGFPPYCNLAQAAALYKIVQDEHPPLPPGISASLKDFLLQCFRKDENMRANAKQLLAHPWIKAAAKANIERRDFQREIEDYNAQLHAPPSGLRPLSPKNGVTANSTAPLSSSPLRSSGSGFFFPNANIRPRSQSINTNPISNLTPTFSNFTPKLSPTNSKKQNLNLNLNSNSNSSISNSNLQNSQIFNQISKPYNNNNNNNINNNNTNNNNITNANSNSNANANANNGSRLAPPQSAQRATSPLPLTPDQSPRNHVPQQGNNIVVARAPNLDFYKETEDDDGFNDFPTVRANMNSIQSAVPFLSLSTIKNNQTTNNPNNTNNNNNNTNGEIHLSKFEDEEDDFELDDFSNTVLHMPKRNQPTLSKPEFVVKDGKEDDEDLWGDMEIRGGLKLKVASDWEEEIEEEFETQQPADHMTLADKVREQVTKQIIDLLLEISPNSPPNNLIDTCTQLIGLFNNHPECKHILISNGDGGVYFRLPLINILESLEKTQNEIICPLLQLINAVIDAKDVQDTICLIGGIPVITKYASPLYSSKIRLEASKFVSSIAHPQNALTSHMFIACRGFTVLVDLLEDNEEPTNKYIVNYSIGSIGSIFQLDTPTPRTAFCHLFTKTQLLDCLTSLLMKGIPSKISDQQRNFVEFLDDDLTKIVDILLFFSQADALVKEDMCKINILKRLDYVLQRLLGWKSVPLLERGVLLKILKVIKNLASDINTLTHLTEAGFIPTLVRFLEDRPGISKITEIHNQVLGSLYNLLLLDRSRQEQALKAGIVKPLLDIIGARGPLKELALPILFALIRSPSSRSSRTPLWNCGVFSRILRLLEDKNWFADAAESLASWALLETDKIIPRLVEGDTPRFLVSILAPNHRKHPSFAKALVPLQQLVNLEGIPIPLINANILPILIECLQTDHSSPFTRLTLLQILGCLFPFLDITTTAHRERFSSALASIAKNDESVLVRNLATNLIEDPSRGMMSTTGSFNSPSPQSLYPSPRNTYVLNLHSSEGGVSL